MIPFIIGAVSLIAYGLFDENSKPKTFKRMAKGGGVDSIKPEGYKKEDAIKYGKKLVDANLKYIAL